MNLKWTKKKPTKVGWYWTREPSILSEDDVDVRVAYVRDYAGELSIQNSAIGTSSYSKTEWAGPIEEPME